MAYQKLEKTRKYQQRRIKRIMAIISGMAAAWGVAGGNVLAATRAARVKGSMAKTSISGGISSQPARSWRRRGTAASSVSGEKHQRKYGVIESCIAKWRIKAASSAAAASAAYSSSSRSAGIAYVAGSISLA